MSLRILLKVFPRQSPSSAILLSISLDADWSWEPDSFVFIGFLDLDVFEEVTRAGLILEVAMLATVPDSLPARNRTLVSREPVLVIISPSQVLHLITDHVGRRTLRDLIQIL